MKSFSNNVLKFLMCVLPLQVSAQTKTFEYTGSLQTYIVPNGVYQIEVELYGASGGWNDYNSVKYDKYYPGKGGQLNATVSVTPGEILYLYVGGKGGDASNAKGGEGGFNGGGNGNSSGVYSGGGGGGATDIRLNGTELSHRILIAGGGGGAAYNYADGGDNGGGGGDLIAEDGFSNHLQTDESRGRGGNQSNGGQGGQWPSYERAGDGSLGQGGNGPAGTCGTGGGGGYYGGGGGCWSGGGGGSSYTYKKANHIVHERGKNEGHGKIIIHTGSYEPQTNCLQPILNFQGPTKICEGETITLHAISNFGATLQWDHNVQNNLAFTPPVGKTNYTVTSNHKKECSLSIEITVIPKSIKATTTNGIICDGESTTLIGHGGENYFWSHGVENNVPFNPPPGINSYTVRSSDFSTDNQCGNEASVFVVVNKIYTNSDILYEDKNALPSILLYPSGGTYPYRYSWSKDGTEIGRDQNLFNLNPGTYEVLVVDAIGCSTTERFTIPNNTQNTITSKGLTASMSPDQIYLDIACNGLLDYKIVNEYNEIILTGTVHNAGKIDISRLPSGNYRICSMFTLHEEAVAFSK